MADITKDSYNEALRFFKVIFQRGRDIRDSELNEFQDILRVGLYRAMLQAIQKTKTNTLNPGSNDDGYLVVGTGANNAVTLKAGWLFCDGIPVYLANDTTFSGFSTNAGAPRTDTVYLALTETEVADPSAVPQLGETSKRRQLQVTVNVSITGPAGVPANTVADIWQGGVHYFKIANIARATGVPAIANVDVTDLRKALPPTFIERVQDPAYPGDSLVAAPAVTAVPSYAPYSLSLGSVKTQIDSLLGFANQHARWRLVSTTIAVDDAGYRDQTLLIDNYFNGMTISLPNPAQSAGRELWILDKIGNMGPTAATSVILGRFATEKIQGLAANYVLQVPFGRWRVWCDGTDWYIFSC